MKRYFKAFGYLLSVHVLALLVMTLFRLVEFIALHGMIVDAEASRVMAFVKGVWFDNVIACYIDRKSTRLNSSHTDISRMPSSA